MSVKKCNECTYVNYDKHMKLFKNTTCFYDPFNYFPKLKFNM